MKHRRPDHLPAWLFRPSRPGCDLEKVRLKVREELRKAYGLESQQGEGEALRTSLSHALCCDLIPAYNIMRAPPGTKRRVTNPMRLFVVVKAIQGMVKKRPEPNPLMDPQLQRVAEELALDIKANRKRKGVASICKLLNAKKGADWPGVKPETLRDNFNAMQRRFGAAYESGVGSKDARCLCENISRWAAALETMDDTDRDLWAFQARLMTPGSLAT